MGDAHLVTGRSMGGTAMEIATVHGRVVSVWPEARREGSSGGWSWTISDGTVVAEAWMHARNRGWWFRIKKADSNG